MKYQINDIIYTKDGRKSGNLCIVDIVYVTLFGDSEHLVPKYICMSDYGNRVETFLAFPSTWKQFYKTPGKASHTHKYYNYKQTHPEEFI